MANRKARRTEIHSLIEMERKREKGKEERAEGGEFFVCSDIPGPLRASSAAIF